MRNIPLSRLYLGHVDFAEDVEDGVYFEVDIDTNADVDGLFEMVS